MQSFAPPSVLFGLPPGNRLLLTGGVGPGPVVGDAYIVRGWRGSGAEKCRCCGLHSAPGLDGQVMAGLRLQAGLGAVLRKKIRLLYLP